MHNPLIVYILTILAGVSLTFAYEPFSLWFIPFLALPFVFYQFVKQQEISGFKLGFVFGLGWFGAGISWVHVSIAEFGGLPLIGSLGLMVLLVAYLSLFPALAFWLTKKFVPQGHQALGFASFWFLSEWLRSWFLTGFPWLSLGYSQSLSPLSALYPVFGETGVTFLLVLSCFFLGQRFAIKPQKEDFKLAGAKALAPLITVVLVAVFAQQLQFSKPTGELVKMAMVQGNIKQEMRWVPEQDVPTMEKYLRLTESLWDNDIILWPEAAVPKLEPLAQEYLQYVDQLAYESNTGLITGIVNYNFETSDAYNSLLVLGKTNAEQNATEYQYFHANRYSKHHLLPVGEFIPLEDWIRGLAPIFDLPMSSFTRGDYEQENLLVNGYRFLPAICFEIAFPRQMAANLREHTNFLLTVSNDAWFGDSHGPAQHLEIAQVRAAEFGLPLLRATNNGITAFVSHKGRAYHFAPQFEDAVLEAAMPITEGMTPYRYWGDLPVWIVVLLSILLVWRGQSKVVITPSENTN